MSKLPRDISGVEAIKIFEKIGYMIVRTKESHVRLRDDGNPNHNPLTIPKHRYLKPGLLKQLMHDASLNLDRFLELRN